MIGKAFVGLPDEVQVTAKPCNCGENKFTVRYPNLLREGSTPAELALLAKLNECLEDYSSLPMENFMEERDFILGIRQLKDRIKGRALGRKFSEEVNSQMEESGK